MCNSQTASTTNGLQWLNKPLVASFPGPTQLSVTCSTASDRKLGGAWE